MKLVEGEMVRLADRLAGNGDMKALPPSSFPRRRESTWAVPRGARLEAGHMVGNAAYSHCHAEGESHLASRLRGSDEGRRASDEGGGALT